MDRRISIEQKQKYQDESGQELENWAAIATIPAEVKPVRGDERVQAQQTASAGDTVFRIRYMSGITTLNRINYDGRIYDITFVGEIGRYEGLEINARSRTE